MKLNEKALCNRSAWEDRGFELPKFDRASMRAETRKAPMWLHFGAGNLFRAFPAMCQQELLNRGESSRGIIVADNAEMVEKIFRAHNELSLTVNLCGDGSIEKIVTGSIAEAVCLMEDRERLQEIFCSPSLQMVTFTITEKGYRLTEAGGAYTEEVEHDRMAGPDFCVSYMGRLAALLYRRYQAGANPLTLVSLDNCSHNGDRLKQAFACFASAWAKSGACDAKFLEYVEDPERVSFPWTMIDKITPRPDAEVRERLIQDGFDDVEGIVTKRGSYVAPFVNAEKTQYLIVEDHFPNGRPPLEKAGVLFTDRATVEKAERMKVSTCLNPLHTALAILGCLLGYTKINKEMQDADLAELVRRIGYEEGLPVVEDPGILSPVKFLDEVLRERFPNPFLPDSPQRIACDTSQKLPVRFGVTVQSYLRGGNVNELKLIPFVFAAWARYLLGIDDEGKTFEISPDPLLSEMKAILGNVKMGDAPIPELLRPIFSRKDIFGTDLYAAGLGDQVEKDFWYMIQEPGRVRKLLQEKLK